MNRYIQVLVKNVRKQLEQWLNDQKFIDHQELYRFLHSMAGTAASIGFEKASDLARTLLAELEEDCTKKWSKAELQSFLFPLIALFYYEETSIADEYIMNEDLYENKQLILLLNDNPALLLSLKDHLESNHLAVIAVATLDRAIKSYYDLDPDCVIIDLHFENKTGLDVLVKLKEHMKQHFIPVIMMCDCVSKEIRMKSYQLGVDDYIEKPIDMDELMVRINRQLERKQAIDQLVLMDELTRVYNRKYLKPTYDRLVSNLKRREEIFSLALVDLDHFKEINDTYGHVIGDKVLETFALTLKEDMRPDDIMIRYGGEEFVFLFPETSVEEATGILNRLLMRFSEITFTDLNEQTVFHCTFSAGVLEVTKHELSLTKNIEIADAALYKAKSEGRSRVKAATLNNLYPVQKKRLHFGIIDDDPIIRTMLIDLIQKSKMSEQFALDIKAFKDGEEFFESNWYEEHHEPYLMILDGMMPRMDGFEVLRNLRKLRYQDQFTIMMLTAKKAEQDISRALQMGADDYITKPFKLQDLERRLGLLLKRLR